MTRDERIAKIRGGGVGYGMHVPSRSRPDSPSFSWIVSRDVVYEWL
jgi:hypothetical protein